MEAQSPPPVFGQTQSPFDPFEPSPRSIEFKSKMQEQDPDEFFFEAHMTLAPMPDMPPPSPPVTPLDARLKKLPSSVISSSDTTMSEHHADWYDDGTTDRIGGGENPNRHDQNHVQNGREQQQDGTFAKTLMKSTMPAGQVASEMEVIPPMTATPTIAVIQDRDYKKSKKSKKKKSKKKSSSKGGTGTSSKEGKSGGKRSGSGSSSSRRHNGKGKGGGKYYSQYSNVSQQEEYGDDQSEDENPASLLSFCRPKKSTTKSLPVWGQDEEQRSGRAYDYNRDRHSMPTPKIGKQLSSNKQLPPRPSPTASSGNTGGVRRGMFGGGRINTGELNSAAGEGTTVPQILSKIRFLTFLLSALTIVLESYAIVFNALFLQAPKVILGVYLLFFIALLLLFEVVRGDPVPTSSITRGGLPFVNVVGGGMNATQVAELAWTIVLERKWARRTRYFLQNNFGMLYSSMGRGVYLCFVGSVAVGQNFILIELLGLGFILMGLWTISLTFRFPSLERAMIMNLEDEFGDRSDDASLAGGGSSVVTWSSIPSSIRSDETRSLLNKSVR
jgi:hypothetical protein